MKRILIRITIGVTAGAMVLMASLFCVAMYRVWFVLPWAHVEDEIWPQWLPVTEKVLNLPGDPQRPVMIQTTLLTPPGAGPFPLAIVNHGADSISIWSRGSRYKNTFFADYFLSRGYAVALPMMRGFAGSGGSLPDTDHGCDVAKTARENARDIRAVIESIGLRSEVDASHIVVIGQSFGGWNTLALGANPSANIAGLINFSGGMTITSCADTGPSLIAGAEEFGRETHIPSIWLYKLFPPSLWQEIYARYTKAGADAELVTFGDTGVDGHVISKYPEFLSLWTPRIDAFLGKIGMPNRLVHPEYIPKSWPKPTGFAKIEDVDAVPYVNDQMKALYIQYLNQPIPKAFLIGPGGFVKADFHGFDPVQDGMIECHKLGYACRVYAVDDQVVWKPLPKAPLASHYAAIDDVKAVPYLSEANRDLYRRFLSKTGPRALVVTPKGSIFAQFGGFDSFAGALLLCEDASPVCEPYAIDNDVVWVPPKQRH